jgi:hypothetical protein
LVWDHREKVQRTGGRGAEIAVRDLCRADVSAFGWRNGCAIPPCRFDLPAALRLENAPRRCGLFASLEAGRIGRGTRLLPQFGQCPPSLLSAQSRQNVHSNEQITASTYQVRPVTW